MITNDYRAQCPKTGTTYALHQTIRDYLRSRKNYIQNCTTVQFSKRKSSVYNLNILKPVNNCLNVNEMC